MHKPERYEETETGVYEQKAFWDPCADDRQDDYKERAIRILEVDQGHYRKHTELIKAFCRGLDPTPITSWGGGHPKLEAMVFPHSAIYIYDGAADMYKETAPEFYSRYGGERRCWWESCIIDTAKIAKSQEFTELNTFCHVLEHQSWATVKEWLRACTKPVLIYGPNIEAAHSDGWFHFRPPDHNTFATAEAMKSVLRERFQDVDSITIDEDYLILAN